MATQVVSEAQLDLSKPIRKTGCGPWSGETEARCPVFNLLKHAKVNVEMLWVKKI